MKGYNIIDNIPNFDLSKVIEEPKYLYNNKPVPRVTEILSDMLHEDYLMEWANNVGLYQHKSHIEYRDEATTIGTYVHEFIERYIKYNEYPDFDNIHHNIKYKVINAFTAFTKWWSIINKSEYKILMQEHELVCEYFGGTLDLLIEINNKIYLVDFKTSKQPNFKYTLQLSAYMYILKRLYNIEVDGCILLMLNKQSSDFREIMYYLHNEDNILYFDYCQECFFSLVYAYYCRKRVEYYYNEMGDDQM